MNLITRIILLFAAVSLLVFLVGGVISYRVMQREVDAEQQRFLMEGLGNWVEFIERRNPRHEFARNQVIITPLDEKLEESIVFSDTIVMHAQLERMESHLKLSAIRNVNDRSYKIVLYGVVVESDDIVEAVTESLIKTYLILLAVILPLGGLVSYFLLKPFRVTLQSIRNFSLQNPKANTIFPKSSVSEFKKLNEFLEEMTQKMTHDYVTLKEFSENASHELQTPLGIVQSKIEVLMDSENLTEDQVNQLSQIENTLKRLSNLSHSLSMLTKIENQEFSNLQEIDLSKTLGKMLDEFAELRELKSISLKADIAPEVKVKVDQVLIELLLTNVINNSIKHNSEGGNISISLSESAFTISNSGNNLDFDPKQLFERFKKSNQSAQSIGLGLAIVNTICELYDFRISYDQANEIHTLTIKFYHS